MSTMKVTVIALVFLVAWCKDSSGIPLSRFYPFGSSAGDVRLGNNDDGSSSAITLSRPFRFFGTSHLRLFVNNNGDISFDTPVSKFTPQSFPLSGNRQLIAPFWADVFTPPGSVWYREASSNSDVLRRAQSDAQNYFTGLRNFRPSLVFIATWEHVGYFGNQKPTLRNKTNTFQSVLVSDGTRSFVYFLYADGLIQWTRGITSSDVDAQVGFNAGDGVRFAAVPESQNATIGDIDNTTNVGVAGVWAFRVDREEITVSTCYEDEPVTLNPLHGSMLGGTGVYIDICEPLNAGQNVTCKFGSRSPDNAIILNCNLAVCVSPMVQTMGYILLEVMITGRSKVITQFLSLSPETSHAVAFSGGSNGLLFSEGDEVTLKWSPENLIPSRLENNVTIDVSTQVQLFNPYFNSFTLIRINISPFINNNGSLKVKFESRRIRLCPVSARRFFSVCPIFFKISISYNQYLPSKISLWSGMAFFKSKVFLDSQLMMQCNEWREGVNNGDLSLFSKLPACPPTLLSAIFDVTYQRESMVSLETFDASYHQSFMEYFHSNVSICYRQRIPLDRGPGQQCCYENGSLVKKPKGGSADRESPLRNFNLHVLTDLVPYILCCKGGTSVCSNTYFQARPEGSDMGYRLPVSDMYTSMILNGTNFLCNKTL